MARKKPAARVATKTAAQKKSPARKSAVGKSAVSKATARKTLKAKARPAAPLKVRRPKQRIAVSHHRDEDFKTDGLRTYARYRDLGIADARPGAGACDPPDRTVQPG